MIATTYFRKSGKVAKLGRTIVLWGLTWVELSNMVNLTICDGVLVAHRLKGTKKDMEEKLQPRDWIKIAKVAESKKKISDKLIRDLSLQNVNVRLEKNGIVESDNKDPALSAYPPTPMPKDQSPDFFARPFEIVLPNLCQLFLSMKKFKKRLWNQKSRTQPTRLAS